jgi:hypothetical protein
MTVALTTHEFLTQTRGLGAMSLSKETLPRPNPGRLDRRAHFIARQWSRGVAPAVF